MKRLLFVGLTLLAGMLQGCGGDNSIADGPDGNGGNVDNGAAVIELLVSTPQLQSDLSGSNAVQITGVVKDSNNAVVEGVAVAFGASSGALAVIQGTTDASGFALASLTNGNDPSNRTITVTANTGQAQASIDISVVGTQIRINGPDSLALNDIGRYTVVLEDSLGQGVPNQVVDLNSANGNSLSNSTILTGVNGDGFVDLTATVAGTDTLTASALGIDEPKTIEISSDAFAFTVPDPDPTLPVTEVSLGFDQPVTVQWLIGGVPQAGQTINFSATRGTLSASSATTNGAGEASLTINSTNAGPAVITATNPANTTTTVQVEFVADTPADLSLQANPFTVASGQQSEISAIVRDPAGNLVKNQPVVFELTDVTNGFLSVGSDVTDSQGRAQTFYTGGSVPSAENGVQIRAFVQTTPAVEDTVFLTVARREVAIAIGTGDELFELGTARYAKEWVVLVTDTVGNPVSNTTIQMTLRSVNYIKGQFDPPNPLADDPKWLYNPSATCPDEDTNRDGFLDLVSEDANANGTLEAGNVATVAAVPGSAPPDDPCTTAGAGGTSTNIQTDNQGFARVCVIYPSSFNGWVEAELKAQVNVFGSEFSAAQEFVLEALADDVNDENSDVTGRLSPFGQSASCADDL